MENFAIMGVLVNQRDKHSPQVQKIFAKYDQIIIGRMGSPDPNREEGLISLNLKATPQQAESFANELSQIEGVTAKSLAL